MAVKPLLIEFGMGTSLRRRDYTQAARRAIEDALWHNSINVAELFGREKTEMILTVEIGVGDPDAVDTDALAAVFPYGRVSVTARKGGLEIPRADGGAPTLIANAVIWVSLDLEDAA